MYIYMYTHTPAIGSYACVDCKSIFVYATIIYKHMHKSLKKHFCVLFWGTYDIIICTYMHKTLKELEALCFLCTSLNTCACIRMHTRACTCMQTHACAHGNNHAHVCRHTHAHMRITMHMYADTRMRTGE